VRYLVDSDYIIDAIARISDSLAVLDRLSVDGLAVSIVTLGELFEGAYIFPDPEAELAIYRQFLSGYAVLPLNEAIMLHFAQTRALLRRQGNMIPDFDLLVGSTAVHHGLTLITRNRRHFTRVPGLNLYHPS
jgi:predicted nucleic acid-binding protein